MANAYRLSAYWHKNCQKGLCTCVTLAATSRALFQLNYPGPFFPSRTVQDQVEPIQREISMADNSQGSFVNDSKARREQLLQKLNKEKAALKRLPTTSLYASHRLKVVNHAIELLGLSSQSTSNASDASKDLETLLAQLSLQ